MLAGPATCAPTVAIARGRRARHAAGAALTAVLLLAPGCARLVRGHHAQIRGIRMYYEVRGHGPPLLMLHGGAGGGYQFDPLVPAFAKRHRLVVPDACAQGRTGDRPGPLTYHDMAEDVVALMDHLHLKTADVMGWSDGGDVGLDLAVHHPDRIRHLVTFGANFTADGLEPTMAEWVRSATAVSFGEAARAKYQLLSPRPAHFEAAMDKILQMWRTLPQFTLADLHQIRAKALIVAGEHDIIRREHTEQLARSIPGAELWIVPGAGHGVMLERSDLVTPRVLEFLSH